MEFGGAKTVTLMGTFKTIATLRADGTVTIDQLPFHAGDEVEVVVTVNKGQPDLARTQVVIPRVTVYQVGRQGASYTPLGAADQSVGDAKLSSLTLLLASDADYQALARARWIGDVDVAVLGGSESN